MSVSEDHLECGLCLELFKNPKMLPCHHTFCHDCLLEYLKNEAPEHIK
jgi:tripartite motif-containing protein 2/3